MLSQKFTGTVAVDSQGAYAPVTDPEMREKIGLHAMENGLHVPDTLAKDLHYGEDVNVTLIPSRGRHAYEIGALDRQVTYE